MASTTSAAQKISDETSPPAVQSSVLDRQDLATSVDSVTQDVHIANSNCPDDRMKIVFESLISHLHAFIRETTLTAEEWTAAIKFLTETGKTCTDVRQEFILLSDVLGASALLDVMNHTKPPGATESTVLGPFYVENSQEVPLGDSIASEGKGDYLFVEGRVLDLLGNPISGAIIDTWETDGFGQYDIQNENRTGFDCRGRLRSASDGSYAFRAVKPIPYPIPNDGPVGRLVKNLNRDPLRPAHLHFRIEAPGYETLITALYFKEGSSPLSDVVFGVRQSLVVEPETINDTDLTLSRGFKEARAHAYLMRDFVLATPEECRRTKHHQ